MLRAARSCALLPRLLLTRPRPLSEIFTTPTGLQTLSGTVSPCSIRKLSTDDEQGISLFEYENFGGPQVPPITYTQSQPNVQVKVSSAIVSKGTWSLFVEPNYTEPGGGDDLVEEICRYATLKEMGICDQKQIIVKSVKKISD